MPPQSDQARWFAAHVQPHEPMLRAWLHNRFSSETDIDDVVQETYLRLLRARIGDLRSSGAPHGPDGLDQLAVQVAEGRTDPYTAADQLVAGLTLG